MKFLVPNYSRPPNPWLGCYRLPIPVVSAPRPQLNFLNLPPPPLPKKNSWVCHWEIVTVVAMKNTVICLDDGCNIFPWHVSRFLTDWNVTSLRTVLFKHSFALYQFCLHWYFLQAPIQLMVPLIHNSFSSNREEFKANMCFLQVPHGLNTSDDEWRNRGCISAIINCRLLCSIPMQA